MDLASLDTTLAADAGKPLNLLNPKSGDVLRQDPEPDAPPGTEGRPVTLTLAGQDSARYRRARNAQVTRRLSRRTPGKVTAEEAEAEGLDLLAACVVSWDGIVDAGEALACTPGAVKSVFTKYPWIREQADAFIHERGNFLQD